MYSIFLTTHILVGVISIVFCLGGILVVFRKISSQYKFFIKNIWILTFLETISGVSVVILDSSSLINFCVSLGIYLALICGVQSLLYYKFNPTIAPWAREK